jgi:hypothetical protein
LTPLLASLHKLSVSEILDRSHHLVSLLDVLMNLHAFHRFFKVKGCEPWLCCTEELRVVHSVVFLVLVSIEIANGPFNLVPYYFSVFVLSVLLQLVCKVQSLQVLFEF